MKTILLSSAFFFICYGLHSQVEQDTIEYIRTDSFGEETPAPAVYDELMVGDYLSEDIAIAEADVEEYNYKFNAFKHNTKLKAMDNPDTKAYYSEGTGTMLRFISDNLKIPYSYNSYSSKEEIVLIQVTVGKDSLLYNPVVLHSNGSKIYMSR